MTALPQELRALSTDQKFELLDALLEDLSGTELALDGAQMAEVEHRIELYESGKAGLVSWSAVKARLAER